ncbi:MAG: prepilin-type N-terminal cleavage/methylation domain-containing protein [Thiobacillus sp.]|jgi:type II secretory pathway component PulJ|uniref:prepilin-type N-terminal cleavage/methylation domain-containing protein n=1 Tax=Thiobacillus sp. TaxID=924 RepID=UPI0028962663|nr:prepilin-type N-terminal cleavage/methylation domain-containing protein [Thiobacillus sp.]MDT3705245.1 prepilin-type N-terminal cleavage/methylation domain-containing protein [Thiobacillus sp.]
MFLNPRIGRQSGFGLVELMIGLLVGMIVVGAAVSLLSTTMASSNDSIKMTRLDQELRQTMTMLTRDLRRATVWDPASDVLRVSMSDPLALSGNTGNVTVISTGGNLYKIGAKAIGGTLIYTVREIGVTTVYRGTVTDYSPSNNGTYSVTLTGTWPADVTKKGITAGNWNILRPESVITTDAVPGTPGVCVLIVYDTDVNGIYEDGERFGYRYDAADKAVEIRTSAASTHTCTLGGSWENLTDENTVEILDFSVTDNSPASFASGGLTVDLREFTISIKGRLKSDHSVERTLQETVRVRNDRLS